MYKGAKIKGKMYKEGKIKDKFKNINNKHKKLFFSKKKFRLVDYVYIDIIIPLLLRYLG